MSKEVKVLSRDTAMKTLTSPMGRTYGAVKSKVLPGLFKIALVDGKPGDVPKELEGTFTKPFHAEQVIRAHISKLWDQAEDRK